MESLKTLNTYPKNNAEDAWDSGYDADGYYDDSDVDATAYGEDAFYEEDFDLDEPYGASAEPLTVKSLREQLKMFATELQAKTELSAKEREALLADFRARINCAAGLGETALQATLAEIHADIEMSFESLPELAALGEDINSLLAEIEGMELPASHEDKAAIWTKQLNKAKTEIDLNLEDGSSTRDLLEEIQAQLGETKEQVAEQEAALNAPIDNLLAYLQSKGDTQASSESLSQALKNAGLSLQDLQNTSLPSSAEVHGKIFNFIKSVDSHLASLISANSDAPYTPEILARFQEVLGGIFPSGALTPQIAEQVFSDAVPMDFPSASEIEKFLSGDDYRKGAHDMLNGEKAITTFTSNEAEFEKMMGGPNNKGNGLLEAMKTGNFTAFLDRWIRTGDDLCGYNRGHAGSTLRRMMSGIYAACDYNPAAFKRVLNEFIPTEVLNEMVGLLNVPGQHNQLQGDTLDNFTLVTMMQEVLNNPTPITSPNAPTPPPNAAQSSPPAA